jgi:hypothetical protein
MKKLHEQKNKKNLSPVPGYYDSDPTTGDHFNLDIKYPNPKLHQQISFIKSAVRILGYSIIPYNLFIAAGVLILSEVIGIIEELV